MKIFFKPKECDPRGKAGDARMNKEKQKFTYT